MTYLTYKQIWAITIMCFILLTGCTGLAEAFAKGQQDYIHSRTPLRDSYMNRLKATDYCEEEALEKGITNSRVKSAYTLDCLRRLDWL
jgi:hypothetical protein